MLGQRLRGWPNIEQALGQRLVLTGLQRSASGCNVNPILGGSLYQPVRSVGVLVYLIVIACDCYDPI